MGAFCSTCYWSFRLRSLDKTNTPRFVPDFNIAKVVDVYDGDTVTLAAYSGGRPALFRCRLTRIDAPELKNQTGKTKRLRQQEYDAAIRSRDALRNLILGRIVQVHILKLEKYGRVLADISIGDQDVSDWMLTNRHAVPYDGGKKTPYGTNGKSRKAKR